MAPATPCINTSELNACLPGRQVTDVKPRDRPMEHHTTRRFEIIMYLSIPVYIMPRSSDAASDDLDKSAHIGA
jgi:hypothetical protein